jgi:hypothetical protein
MYNSLDFTVLHWAQHSQFHGLTLYVPRIPEWDAGSSSSGITGTVFGISRCVTRDGLRAEDEECSGKFFFAKVNLQRPKYTAIRLADNTDHMHTR